MGYALQRPPQMDKKILTNEPQMLEKTPKPFSEVVVQRRATRHFQAKPIPKNILNSILESASLAPSGNNLQPWRFILVTESDAKARLQKAAMDQRKISEAPVVVIALGMTQDWQNDIREILREGAERGAGKPEQVAQAEKGARDFLAKQDMRVWVTKHTTIAFTFMMLAAESYGISTAPMEGFDPLAVKKEFAIPDEAEVVALLAMGYKSTDEKPFPGRYPIDKICYQERFGGVFTR